MNVNRFKLAGIIAVLTITCILIIAFGINYFSQKEFYLNEHKYQVDEENHQEIRYTSYTGDTLIVKKNEANRSITLNGQQYIITVENHPYDVIYLVKYPDDTVYKVKEPHSNKNTLIAFDENDEFITGVTVFKSNQGSVMRYGKESYHPTDLVVAAYPQYQQQRGMPVLYYLSIVLFIFGWCSFRYEKFQNVMFWVSLKWIWTENPEPSEFFYFMSKIGGILTMLLAFVLFIQSLSNDLVIPL